MSRVWEDWAQHEQDHCPQLLTVEAVISHRCSRKGMSVLDNDESLSVSERKVLLHIEQLFYVPGCKMLLDCSG